MFVIVKILTLTLLLLLGSSGAFADSAIADSQAAAAETLQEINGWETKWSQCKLSSDCKLISYGPGCYWLGAVKEEYQRQANIFLSAYYKSKCDKSFLDRATRTLSCIDNKCRLN